MLGIRTPEDFQNVATAISRLMTAIALVIGGLFALYKFLQFEEKSLGLQLAAAESLALENIGTDLNVSVHVMYENAAQRLLETAKRRLENCQNLQQEDDCDPIEDAIEKFSLRDSLEACGEEPEQIFLPPETILLSVSESVRFSNLANVPFQVSATELRVSEIGDHLVANDEREAIADNGSLAAFRLNSSESLLVLPVEEVMVGPTVTTTGQGADAEFSSFFQMSLEFACGETSKTIFFEMDLLLDQVSPTELPNNPQTVLRRLGQACTIVRSFREPGLATIPIAYCQVAGQQYLPRVTAD